MKVCGTFACPAAAAAATTAALPCSCRRPRLFSSKGTFLAGRHGRAAGSSVALLHILLLVLEMLLPCRQLHRLLPAVNMSDVRRFKGSMQRGRACRHSDRQQSCFGNLLTDQDTFTDCKPRERLPAMCDMLLGGNAAHRTQRCLKEEAFKR